MSTGANQRPEDAPLSVFLVESFDGVRVQVVVSASFTKLARCKRDGLQADHASEEAALSAAQHTLHLHGKRALDDLRSCAYRALDCYVEQLEVCARDRGDGPPNGGQA